MIMLKFIPLKAQAGIAGFESPAAEYTQLTLTLDQILIDHPAATYLGFVEGDSMTGVGIFLMTFLWSPVQRTLNKAMLLSLH